MLSIDSVESLFSPSNGHRLRRFALGVLLMMFCIGAVQAQTFGGSNPITLTSANNSEFNSVGSTVVVSGLSGTVTAISVTFNSLNLTNLNSVGMALVAPGGTALDLISGVCGSGTQQVGSSTFTISDSGDTGLDNFHGMMSALGEGTCPSAYSGTYYASDYFAAQDIFHSPGPASYKSGGVGPPTCTGTVKCGSDNFSSTFLSLPTSSMNGTWSMYIANQYTLLPTGSLGSWTITFVTTTGAQTTTTLAAGTPNPAYTNVHGAANLVTFTAVVSPNPASGTVTFFDGATAIASNIAVNGSGVASTSVTFTTEGNHSITAKFNGSTGFAASPLSNAVTETTMNHVNGPISNPDGSTGFCNGPVALQSQGGGNPYPSLIILGGTEPTLSGVIQKVTVTLNGLETQDPQPLGFALQAPGASHAFQFLSWAGGSSNNIGSPINMTLSDTGSASVPEILPTGQFANCPFATPCLPTDNFNQVGQSLGDGFPAPAPTTIDTAGPTGTSTFATDFGSLGVNGTWKLYLNNRTSEAGTLGQISSWCMNFTMQANAHATTTAVTGSPNPASTSGSATLTANVTSDTTVNAGSVTFVDGTTNIGSANVANGVATLSGVTLAERTHKITASYGGTNTGTIFGISSGTFDIRLNHPTAETGFQPYNYCNAGAIAVPGLGADVGVAAPYPSNIVVTNLPGTVKAATVTLKNFSTNDVNDLVSLLVGPGGNNLDFFSLTGSMCSGAPCHNTFGPVTVTFDDTASSIVNSDVISGSFKPTSFNIAGGGGSPDAPVAYPACPPNAADCASPPVGPPLPANPFTPAHKAATAGTSLLGNANAAGVFGGTTSSTYNGNGTWSLYLDDANTGAGRSDNLAGGWCVNLTENPVIVAATKSHTGPAPGNHFRQGGTGQFSFAIQNNGPGPTGDPDGNHPLTVTDTLASGLGPGSPLPTGTPWDCAAVSQVISCKNHGAIAQGSSYPTLTIPVTVAGNASASVNNQASVSGAGSTSTTTNIDSVTIDPAPVLAIAKSHAGTFTQGATANWTLQVGNNAATAAGATDGSTVTVTDALPTGYTLSSFAGTGWSCGGTATVTCTSTTVVAGAGGTFPPITLTVNVPAASPTSVPNTAGVFGGGDVIHTNAGNAAASNTDTVTVIQVPASITINAGATQHAPVNQNFGTALAATVKDAGAVVIPNYSSVTFTAQPGGGGQSGTFTANGSGTRTLTTDGSGVANAGTFAANGNAGAYTVDVAAGPAPHATFNLSNFAEPTFGKSFNPTSIAPGGSSALGFTVTNPAANPNSLTGIAFTDTLPTGVTVATPNGLTGSCGGGTITAVAGSSSVALSGATLAAGASCTFGIHVTATALGSKVNVTGAIASNEGGIGGTATATLAIKTSSSVTLTTACPKTFVDNQLYTITATVTGSSPTGTVVFDDGAIGIGGCLSVPLVAGSANCATSTFATGVNDLIAGYSGDADNTTSNSSSLFVTAIDPADALFLGGFEQTIAGCPSD